MLSCEAANTNFINRWVDLTPAYDLTAGWVDLTPAYDLTAGWVDLTPVYDLTAGWVDLTPAYDLTHSRSAVNHYTTDGG